MNKIPSVKEIKTFLSHRRYENLVRLIIDLYSLNKENRDFINTYCSSSKDMLDVYKNIIQESIYPDFDESIELSVARKAISDYKKASGNKVGVIELMVYYVETGTECILDYGDMYEAYYDSLESMFTKVIGQLEKSGQEIIDKFIPRLRKIVKQTVGIGWGYHDYLADCFGEAFPDKMIEV